MDAFETDDLVAAQHRPGERTYVDFLRKEMLSLGMSVWPAGGEDTQQPHTEDEVYVVMAGRGQIRGAGEARAGKPGAVVPAAVARGAAGGRGGRTLGGVVLARYGPGSTLEYHELVVFAGVARVGARVGFVVAYIAVDSPASLAGGREIWGLPKRAAEFAWAPSAIVVAEEGVEVLRARV